MLKLVGALLLVCASAWIGFGCAGRLKGRVNDLRSFLSSTEVMEREIAFRLTATPDLLELLAQQAEEPARGFFACCLAGLDRLGEKSLAEIWHSALLGCSMNLTVEDRLALDELGGMLGRYDGQGQREALETIRAQLRQNLDQAQEEYRRMGRVYGALGLAAGSFVAIMLV